MKKIRIDKIISDDLNVVDGKDFTIGENKETMTTKHALVNHCGLFQAKDGNEAIRAYEIGMKIKNTKETITLEEDDFEFLKKGPLSQPKYFAIVMAQIFRALENAETIDPNKD